MKAFTGAAGHVLRLDPGEEIMESLAAYLQSAGIEGAAITGIGAVKESTIGYFDLHKREYRNLEIPGDMELVSFMGSLTWADGEPVIHAHVTLSGEDYIAKSGHLFSAVIAVTGEFWIQPTGMKIERALNERTGLKLIK